ncbi:hypothetical protein MX659_06975 [Coriobacteriia bacterium Es71-Z0120]|uniref:hypothetical protein n=1 Tax=Parvivirga hydrogeniphila TaxID=2939460 RepID=UPI002260C64D|nr:hypothetical protein [Parvivirga hydrogeniphila]MCL4079323.1 hypothetical protein [Parvivirga hydrogeniphila]
MQPDALIDRIVNGWSAAVRLFPRVLQDPRAYPRETMILAALVALAIVFVMLTGFVVADAAKAQRLRVRRKGAAARRLAAVALVAAGVVVLISAAPTLTVVSKRCTTCHAIAPEVAAWKQGAHASVSCYGCHAQPGPLGAAASSLARVRYLRGSGESTVAPVQVSTQRCLSCHRNIRSGVVGKRVRMRHSDVLDAGYTCVSCHPHAGHETPKSPGGIQQSAMNACLSCHDGQAAPAGCGTCHASGGPLDTAETTGTSVVRLTTRCTGCHTQQSARRCVACHGLELPHPAGFMSEHAGLSYRSPSLCAKCHEQASPRIACGCHQDVNVHGTYSEWFPLHGPMARSNGPGGCRCHDASFCGFCHDKPVF